jgi:hypothetical protein
LITSDYPKLLHCTCAALSGYQEAFKAAADADDERPVQQLYNAVTSTLCNLYNQQRGLQPQPGEQL